MDPFRWRSRIQFVDTDASGRIHYTALLRHFEAAEMEFMRHRAIPYNHLDMTEIALPRVHVEADYLAALTFEDLIDIEVAVERLGDKSFTLGFIVFKGETVAGRGRIVVVAMDRATQRSCSLPEPLREGLRQCVNSSPAT